MARNERELIDKGREALAARLSAELKQADDESSVDQALDAESTIEQYLEAVDEKSTSLPDRQELAFACVLLLVISRTLAEDDLELLGRLNAPELSVSMFAIFGQIADMKTRAIAGLEKLAGADREDSRQHPLVPSDDGNVPF